MVTSTLVVDRERKGSRESPTSGLGSCLHRTPARFHRIVAAGHSEPVAPPALQVALDRTS